MNNNKMGYPEFTQFKEHTLNELKAWHEEGFQKVKNMVRSPWILHFDTGGCNGCSIEIEAGLTPRYDLERFGVLNKGNPKLADVLLVTGAVTSKSREVLLNLYEQIPEPKVVVAVGSCCCDNGVYEKCYNLRGPLNKVLPVDVYIPGCPPRPGTIIEALKIALDLWRKKHGE